MPQCFESIYQEQYELEQSRIKQTNRVAALNVFTNKVFNERRFALARFANNVHVGFPLFFGEVNVFVSAGSKLPNRVATP